MASIIARPFSGLARIVKLSPVGTSLLNKNLVANAWVGSYRIRNAQDYLDTFPRPRRWPRYNELINPPQTDPTEDRRPATYHHYRENIKYSAKNMWYLCKFVKGQNIDEAIKQLRLMNNKGAQICAEVLEEAREKAVKEHNFEFRSNMWIEECHSVKGLVVKGLRKHARMRYGVINYHYSHLLIKLTEGEPPVHFYRPPKDGNDYLKDYFDGLRSRKIDQGL